jgi:hypothetical protein
MMFRKAVAPRVSASSMRTSLKSFWSQIARMALAIFSPGTVTLVAHFQPAEKLYCIGVAGYATAHRDARDGVFFRVAIVRRRHAQPLSRGGNAGARKHEKERRKGGAVVAWPSLRVLKLFARAAKAALALLVIEHGLVQMFFPEIGP